MSVNISKSKPLNFAFVTV